MAEKKSEKEREKERQKKKERLGDREDGEKQRYIGRERKK